ncbi:DUF6538 domain-containing protein [uncultured Sphingomonas sp.]|uniref:DUF6538 domain-containing protein n=1 Tax=uncultured Sphingomonas sp. TaxID=158754 RepID=UPI0025CF9534|nr:DUF6538 domain-containing protein [uncultured Sphingomonas sp.]
MSHSHRRKTSRIEWFRMDVPKDIRHLAGKTSWQHSLETTDPALADARRAWHAARYKTEVIRLRAQLAAEIDGRAEGVVEQAFDKLAAFHGSLDRAVAAELDSLAWTVRGSWSREDAHEVERQLFGREVSDEWTAANVPVRRGCSSTAVACRGAYCDTRAGCVLTSRRRFFALVVVAEGGPGRHLLHFRHILSASPSYRAARTEDEVDRPTIVLIGPGGAPRFRTRRSAVITTGADVALALALALAGAGSVRLPDLVPRRAVADGSLNAIAAGGDHSVTALSAFVSDGTSFMASALAEEIAMGLAAHR